MVLVARAPGRVLALGLALWGLAWGGEAEAERNLEAHLQGLGKTRPLYFFGDKALKQSFHQNADELQSFEITLHAQVGYLLVAATDSDLDSLDIEGQKGFEGDGGGTEDGLFPFYLSFLKRQDHPFTVPKTGTYRFVFRFQPRWENGQLGVFVAWTLGFQLPKGPP